MSDWRTAIKMELPVTNADGSVDRTVVVTSHYYTDRVREMFFVEVFQGPVAIVEVFQGPVATAIGKLWTSEPIYDVAKAFQVALDRAAYGLRVQNRRK